ncbi:cation transporting ATPase C-terminal domain-containing protein [Empedobacter tilapiae]
MQGLVITIGILFIYQYSVLNGGSEEKTGTMFFTNLILANILLSHTNRSFYYSFIQSLKNKNSLFPITSVITIVLFFSIRYIKPVANFF